MKALLLLIGMSVFPLMASASPPAPQTIVIVSCKFDDLTGTRPLPENVFPARDWRDIEPHLDKDGDLECKRAVVPLEDKVAALDPTVQPLMSNFGDPNQCGRAGMMFGPDWERQNKPWVVVAVGCPTPITDDQGTPLDTNDDVIVDWHLPGCPTQGIFAGLRCKFDESTI